MKTSIRTLIIALFPLLLPACAGDPPSPAPVKAPLAKGAAPPHEVDPQSAARESGEPEKGAPTPAPREHTKREESAPVTGGAEPAAPEATDEHGFGKYVPPEDAQLAQGIAVQMALLAGGSESERSGAVEWLLETGDPAVIPVLIDQLARRLPVREDDDKLRSKIVKGLLQTFQPDAFEICRYLVLHGNENQQKSGLFGLGQVDHPDQADLVLPFIAHENQELRQAATYALITPASLPSNAAEHIVVNGALPQDADPEVVEALFERHTRVRSKVIEEICKYDLDLPDEIFAYVRRFATHDNAQALLEHYVLNVPEEERPVATLLSKMFNANRRWLGRAAPMPADMVSYDFHMFNVVGNKGKDVPIQFGQRELDMLRGKEYHLDRATKMAFALDGLFVYPQLCKPELEGEESDEPRLRYQIPLRATLSLGPGTMNIAYWVGRAEGAHDATVTVDPERFVPLEETIRDEAGETVAMAKYGEYVEIEPGAWVPLKLEFDCLRVPQGETVTRHMRYAAEFQVVQNLWLLREATALEVTDGVEETRATADIDKIRIQDAMVGPEALPNARPK